MTAQRKALWAGIAVLGTAIGFWLFAPRPVLVEVAQVTVQKFTAFVEGDGRTRVRDRHTISASLAGRVPRTTLRVGDAVKAGQTLITITPNVSPLIDPRTRRELEERLGAAQAAVEEAAAFQEKTRILLTQARTVLERTTQLKSRGIAAIAQFDRDTFTVDAAEREHVAAERRRHASEHALEVARAALQRGMEPDQTERFFVTSPIDGQVLKVVQESEGVVGLGSPLLEVGDTQDLEIIVDILTSDAVQLREGNFAILERSGTPSALQGRVRRIEPSGFTKLSALGVEEQRVWILLDVISPRSDWSSLGDGYRIAARIVIDEIERAIVIPTGALFRRGDEWSVFVVKRGRANLRKVDIGRRSGRTVVIVSGLAAGETVIIFPASTLEPGTTVKSR